MLPYELPHAEGDIADPEGGVWSSSSPEQYVIFSLDPSARLSDLYGWIGFKGLRGSWQGIEEASFIVNARDWPKVRDFALKQDCVLHLGPAYEPAHGPYKGYVRCARKATLFSQNGGQEVIGRFVPCSEGYARKQEGWTYDPTENQYYVVV